MADYSEEAINIFSMTASLFNERNDYCLYPILTVEEANVYGYLYQATK